VVSVDFVKAVLDSKFGGMIVSVAIMVLGILVGGFGYDVIPGLAPEGRYALKGELDRIQKQVIDQDGKINNNTRIATNVESKVTALSQKWLDAEIFRIAIAMCSAPRGSELRLEYAKRLNELKAQYQQETGREPVVPTCADIAS